jgi:hypothetical protein
VLLHCDEGVNAEVKTTIVIKWFKLFDFLTSPPAVPLYLKAIRCIALFSSPLPFSQIGNLLAGWMHWYWGMPLQEAILSTELGTGCRVQQVRK